MKSQSLTKTLCAAIVALGSCLCAEAVPAKHGTITLTQPDGSVITLQRVGDEHFHTLVTIDGLPVAKSADGYYRYALPSGLSALAVNDPEKRTDEEVSFINAQVGNLSVEKLAERQLRRKSPAGPNAAPDQSQVPHIGSPRIPVLLVAYKDYQFRDGDKAHEVFTDFFEAGETSARQYFVDQSNGLYTPEFDVYGPITLPEKRVAYGGNDETGNDVGVGRMVAEACQLSAGGIDFSVYDNNGDGECDVVIVLYAGDGEASSTAPDCEDAVWPMQNSLDTSDFGKYLTLNGVKVNKFAVFNELSGENINNIDGIGTFCHEFSHCLGLPDFYDTNYGGHFGMGDWSLMDNGCYNNSGYTPIGYSAYEKEFMGWIEIKEAEKNTSYTLTPMNRKSLVTDMAIRLTNQYDPNEYYIVENRARTGWDHYLPAEGLMITHVTYSPHAWRANYVNDFDLQRMTIIPADNELKMAGINADKINMRGDLWPYGGSHELTDTSVPAAKVNTGGYMGKPITDMVRNSDGTISFNVMKGVLPGIDVPILAEAEEIGADGFTASWQHAPATDVTYTLEVTDHADVASRTIHSQDFTVAQDVWSTEGYTSQSAAGIRLGSGSSNGKVTSPELVAPGEDYVTVVINAKNYSPAESSYAGISIIDSYGIVLDSKSIPLANAAADYAEIFKINTGKPFFVSIETVAIRRRFVLAKVDILSGDMTDVVLGGESVPSDYVLAAPITITGISAMSRKVEGLKAGTYDFRVKAVPADAESWAESGWSDRKRVTINATGSVGDIIIDGDEAEYFNLQGCRVDGDHLVPGVYIMRTAAGAKKIIIR